MLIKKIYSSLAGRIQNYRYEKKDTKIKRKIVVIESDDWGAIRMPSKKVFDSLSRKNDLSKCHYCTNDSIMTDGDIDSLIEVLAHFKDNRGRNPIITANFVTSNPDFRKIKENDFQNYYNESIKDTIEKYPDISWSSYQKAIAGHFIQPQLHGREHLNVSRWMGLLKKKNSDFLRAFNEGVYGLSTTVTNSNHLSVMAAFRSESEFEDETYKAILSESCDNFKKLFGFESLSFVAPNYWLNPDLSYLLKNKGVRIFQGARKQLFYSENKNNFVYHYTGEINLIGQLFLVRNVFFEPSSNSKKDHVNECLSAIDKAFDLGQAAIICSHRVNYVGRIFEKNRINSLNQLSTLLEKILLKWPDVEFMSSDELGDIIEKDQRN